MNQLHTISGPVLREMIISGAALLEKNKGLVDSLNVFPVPDGDTGTNMSMTMNSAIRELKSSDAQTASEVMQAVSKGALRGARGNSGVILSQLFRGMSRALEGVENVAAFQLAQALAEGSDAAYKAVMKPKEGTILTVARLVAEKSQINAMTSENVYKVIDGMVQYGEEVLARTPDMLAPLKEAGVVDSGGKGLLFIYRGFKMALDGDSVEDYVEPIEDVNTEMHDNEEIIMVDGLDEIKFAYCTEFFIEHLNPDFDELDVDKLRDHLQRIGDSVVAVADENLVKVHVHTNVPGKALQMALRLGEINGVKIENMKEQHRRLVEERKAREKEFGMVAVSVGDGLDKIFKDLSVDAVISGGQTMNPSSLDIERAIKRANARNVFVFPNNKNIILAARQAADMVVKSTGISVAVIPTDSVTQGLSAALAFSSDLDRLANEKAMKAAIAATKSGSVTYAVRTAQVNGHSIKEGDFMGMVENEIHSAGKDLDIVIDEVMSELTKDGGDVITLIYGMDVKLESAKKVCDRISEKYPDFDVLLQSGGQPLYYYYISVE